MGPGVSDETPTAEDLLRAARLAEAVTDGAKRARERLDEEGASWGAVRESIAAIAGVGLRGLLLVLERAGPIVADVAADAIVTWLESRKGDA
jgi:hypothetical protein